MLSGGLWSSLRNRFENRDTLRAVIGNSFWLFCEQVLRMIAGLLVGVWVARYLGPERYGWLNYALVTVGVVTSLTSPGVGAVVVRELAQTPAETRGWMGATFFLRAAGASIGFLACVVIAWWHSGAATPASALTLVLAAGILLQTFDIGDLLLQARGESRVAAWVRMGVCIFGSALRVALILAKAPLLAFAIAGVIEIAAAAAGWLWAVRRCGQGFASWACERRRALALLRETWPLTVSGFAIIAQAYADQLIIGALLGAEELGQYAAAMRLVSVFAFVPMVIQTVSAPEIARAKRDDETLYRRRLHSLYRVMFGVFTMTAVALILFGPPAARLLYGGSYAGAAALLPWLAFRLFFTNLGVARSLFITNEGLFRFALFTSTVGAIVNIGLNFVLVPRWGARGAIAASFVSFGITTFALEIFQAQARANLWLMARAVFLPWRRFAG
jgi:O-antigen/teichoic acid export membrane protein